MMLRRNIRLSPEQVELLGLAVEASRNVPREGRRKFMVALMNGQTILNHPGLKGNTIVYEGDVEELEIAGLIRLQRNSQHSWSFDVTPDGFEYYESLKQELGEPVERVEKTVRSFIDSDDFRKRHPEAHRLWAESEALLWSSDDERHYSTIGHKNRECIQAFATDLVTRFKPADVDADRAHTVARLRTVLNARADALGGKKKALADALLVYWGTVSDLVQRLEHAGLKDGEPVNWEDARQVVFLTLQLMHEVDRALGR